MKSTSLPADPASGSSRASCPSAGRRKKPARERTPVSRWAAALVALAGLSSSAFAQVDYVRDIAVPDPDVRVLSISQSPFADGSPHMAPYLTTLMRYWTLDASEGEFVSTAPWPIDIKLNTLSVLAWAGGSSSSRPGLFAVTSIYRLVTFDAIGKVATGAQYLSSEFTAMSSLAARSLDAPTVSLLADNGHFTIDPSNGNVTEMPLAGVDAGSTWFMAYGADGFLYVLDYGNSRIASFDPDNAFAPVGSFDLQTGVTTANEQFAIGANGSFYLTDGSGGGSYYNSLGEFQGTFAPPEDSVAAPYLGQPFLTTDETGNILVYDSDTGLHQYQDTSVVPEPGTVALIGLGALAFVLRRRVIRS